MCVFPLERFNKSKVGFLVFSMQMFYIGIASVGTLLIGYDDIRAASFKKFFVESSKIDKISSKYFAHVEVAPVSKRAYAEGSIFKRSAI